MKPENENPEVVTPEVTPANHLASIHAGEVKPTEEVKVEETQSETNHLASVHAGEIETSVKEGKTEEVDISALSNTHSENPKDEDGKIVTNHYEAEQTDETPTHLGGIKLEKEEE